MRLGELIAGLGAGGAPAHGQAPRDPALGTDPEIGGLAYDSRSVRPGALFFCVSGMQSDGHDFAPDAVARGAVALVVERRLGLGVPEVVAGSTRALMGPVAARFYGDPTSELAVVGVTGTNGKTTTAFLVRALLEAGGRRCGLLGTVKAVVGGAERAVARTTPEAIDLQADFRAMLDGGDRACAMEVSSHALELGRADAIRFAVAIFTNLSRDHLDFHDSMDSYYEAKRRLFIAADGGRRAAAVSVVNVGDPYGRRLAGEIRAPRTFAVEAPADYSARDLRCDIHSCRFTLRTPAGEREVALGMPGRFNVANALGALAAAHVLGVDLDTLIATLDDGVRVPGRFQPVDEGQGFAVLVDYAHTPDSLQNALAAARELLAHDEGTVEGRVICVFGAGGDRDRGKRPLMGEVAARMADVVIVTSDNPRSEDPEQIIADVMSGAARADDDGPRAGGSGTGSTGGVQALTDRAAAIATAVAGARRGDIVVIAGKGHEQGQELAGGVKVDFDDVAVARKALQILLAAPADAGRSAPAGTGR